MKLKNLGLSGDWRVQRPIPLRSQNLIVGVNASGKSSVISRIEMLARLVSGDMKPAQFVSNRIFEFIAEFESDTDEFTYELKISGSSVIHERFLNGNEALMTRDPGGIGRIHYAEKKETLDFQTPQSALALVSREDSRQHPFFQPLINWGRNLYCAYFGAGLVKREVLVAGSTPSSTSLDDPVLRPNTEILVLLHRGLVSRAREDFKKHIIVDMNRMGYFIEDIDFRTAQEFSSYFPGVKSIHASFGPQSDFRPAGTPIVAFIKEQGIDRPVDQFQISEGMWRALAIIVYLNFVKISAAPSCIVIDDIGEGLDFERSCSLIKLVQERAAETDVQLIMSTNDRFVMNSVPLENWIVLRRNGSVINAFNYENSQEIFDQFKDTGLNNFDFLRLDFLDPQHQEIR